MIVGFLLSPLSWWNDLLVNLPLAYLFATPFSWLHRSLFGPALIVGYLLTNIIGFVLMHHGFRWAVHEAGKLSVRRELKKDLLWSLLYTLFVVLLLALGWVKPPMGYFH